MGWNPRRRCIEAGFLAVVAALAPAPARQDQQAQPPQRDPAQQAEALARAQQAQAQDNLEALGKSRAAVAIKMYDLAWIYYSENRIDAGDVYGYSRLLLIAEQDVAANKAGRVEAALGHRDRMERLWKKVSRVKKLGFSNTLDVNEAEYYYREADFWLAREQAWVEK